MEEDRNSALDNWVYVYVKEFFIKYSSEFNQLYLTQEIKLECSLIFTSNTIYLKQLSSLRYIYLKRIPTVFDFLII